LCPHGLDPDIESWPEAKGKELLSHGANELGIRLGTAETLHFQTYLKEVLHWSERTNLTGLPDAATIIRLGFLDSLALAPLITANSKRLIDLGSGAGFPAIPIAIVRPDLHITLVEISRKKISFLRHIVRLLKLPGVEVQPGRIEILLDRFPMLAGSFDIGLARAVAPPIDAARMILPFLRSGGVFLAQIGSGGEPAEQLRTIQSLGFELLRAIPVPDWIGRPGRRILALKKTDCA
jgi:16S rRNA (guanine527-N7)-methyltransferase